MSNFQERRGDFFLFFRQSPFVLYSRKCIRTLRANTDARAHAPLSICVSAQPLFTGVQYLPATYDRPRVYRGYQAAYRAVRFTVPWNWEFWDGIGGLWS